MNIEKRPFYFDLNLCKHECLFSLQFGLSHPASQIDMQLVSNFADNPSSMAAGLEMNYLSAGARQRSNMRLRGEIQKLRSAINMEVSRFIWGNHPPPPPPPPPKPPVTIHYLPFVRGIHRSPVDSLHKGQVMLSFVIFCFTVTLGWN